MGVFTSIATAVLPSLIGGIFGSKKKETTQRINFKQLRDDAKAAGFNPLTALGATGGAGNVTTTTPALASGDFLAEALDRGLTAWSNQAQLKKDAEAEQLKLDLMREELTGMKRRNSLPAGSFGFDIPTVTGTGPTSGGLPGRTEVPYLLDPIKVMRPDGLTSANPDNAPEAEQDAWVWAREGSFLDNASEILRRNITSKPLLTWGDKVLWDW